MTGLVAAVVLSGLGQNGQEQGRDDFLAFVKVVEGLRGEVLPEVKGLRFVLFEEPNLGSGTLIHLPGKHYGWVGEPGGEGRQIAITPELGFVVVGKVIEEADPALYVPETRGALRSYGYPMGLFGSALFYLAGEEEAAKSLFDKAGKSDWSFEESLRLAIYASAARMAVGQYRREEFESSRVFIETMKRAYAGHRTPSNHWGDGELAGRLEGEIERRRGVNLASREVVAEWAGERRLRGIIDLLEREGAYADTSLRYPISQFELLVGQTGEDLVPLLIEAVRSDERYTLGLGGNPFYIPDIQPVSKAAYRHLERVWSTIPFRSTEVLWTSDGRRAIADRLSVEWDVVKTMNVAERHYHNVTHPRASDQVAVGSMLALLRPYGYEATVDYTPGEVPFLIEQLREEERGRLGRFVEGRLLNKIKGQSWETVNFSSRVDLVCVLARLKGEEALPALRRYTSMVLAQMASSPSPRWGDSGPTLAHVVSQRIALGDTDAALADYRRFLKAGEAYGMRAESLRLGWEHPENVAVQNTVRLALRLFEEDTTRRVKESPDSSRHELYYGMQMVVLDSPAIREWLIGKLRSEETLDVAVHTGEGRYAFDTPGRGRHSFSFRGEAATDLPDEILIRRKDYVLRSFLSGSPGFFEFEYGEPLEARDGKIGLFIRMLSAREFRVDAKWRNTVYPEPRRIYFPGDPIGFIRTN